MAIIEDNFIILTVIVTVGYQLLFFCIAASFKFDKVTDFAGGTNFVVLAVMTALIKGTWHTRQVVMTLLVVLWGLRLAIFLLLRILQWGEDKRFDDTRTDFLKLAAFWVFQAIWVWTVTLPVTIVNQEASRNPAIGVADIIGWTMWGIGLSVEAAADQQKLRFKSDPANRSRWCNVGVWKWSRHPNYFGEILLWWGVFVAATPVLKGYEWASVASPLFTMSILLFLSGMPLLEASADKKFAQLDDYRHYKSSTSPLIPLPPLIYGSMPAAIKTLFFLEWPIYSSSLEQDGDGSNVRKCR
eukprot:TRINITY_DN1236_c0_g1_i4.p1 TRINITY_DN1236_c0_g1~~TRINITY_DN1236_c0_g1_i4.p1  ORF type:complete len:299 (+),score=90.89 TRINITY_DN1236_c0_g1_i4:83-979(+)